MPNWVDGHPAESISIKDRGLAYGDGLFETIAVRAGRPPLLEYHMARLAEGCRRLGLPLDLQQMRTELLAFSAGLGEGVVKLMVTRGEGLRGYAPPPVALPRRILQSGPFPAYPESHREQGVQLFPCATRLAEQPLLAGLKHLNRLEQVLARAEWQGSEFAEGLMRDQAGRVVEGVFSNLFIARDGVLVTADLSRCGVAGVMRAALLDAVGAAGIPAEVRDIVFEEFLQADEVFLCNSLFGIWPVRSVTGHHWPVGPLTRKLQAIARDLLDI
ncbi:aminodeoxychorismate lyase [Pseudomonas sp. Q1-7]|uniref:aminodeoxychorismate lyase n=1 Tax=Pseudomonas sp. Q1-7 TaxID=3020843 RepID=UPI0023000B7B|nr:aminodeoxychorismate lyase [Pseudomonas sp. Q1-7]